MLSKIYSILLQKSLSSNRVFKLIVFNFHNIEEAGGQLAVSNTLYKSEFLKQVKWIRKYFNVITLEEGVDKCRAGLLKEPTACITFDDGYKSHYAIAAPILKSYSLPATFFVSTGHLDTNLLWNDVLQLFCNLSSNNEKKQLIERLNAVLDELSIDACNKFNFKTVEFKLKYMPLVYRRVLLDYMKTKIPEKYFSNLMLSSNEIKALHDEGFTVGSHTKNHPILAVENEEVFETEIISDIDKLAEIIGEPPRVFAYPNGKYNKDYKESHIQVLMKHNIFYAVTTNPGCFFVGTDNFQIPRVNLFGKSDINYLRTVVSSCRTPPDFIESRGYQS